MDGSSSLTPNTCFRSSAPSPLSFRISLALLGVVVFRCVFMLCAFLCLGSIPSVFLSVWRFTFESEHSRIRFMENFKHFVLFDRRKIERFLKKKKSLRFIAGKFGRSVSSVSDEISRNSVKGTYD